MIVYLSSAAHTYTMHWFLEDWAPDLDAHVIPYEVLPYLNHVPAATYIFSDIERLNGAGREVAISVRDQIAAAAPKTRFLNDPSRSMGRLELLEALHKNGRNRFRAVRATEKVNDLNSPVFIRDEREHDGALSRLLYTQTELNEALQDILRYGFAADRLLVVEFCNTADADGIYRKYSSFIIDDQIIPRHLMHGHTWMVKEMDFLDTETVVEEREYLTGNPHESILREIFELAHIDYGRIDYSLLDGNPQVWEINTNPVILEPRERYAAGRLPSQKQFAELLLNALEAVDHTQPGKEPIPISIDPALVKRAIAAPWKLPILHGRKTPKQQPVPRPGIPPASAAPGTASDESP